eukprot:scaffold86982_cov15-Tisochrysis_lutea.AAC.1
MAHARSPSWCGCATMATSARPATVSARAALVRSAARRHMAMVAHSAAASAGRLSAAPLRPPSAEGNST